MPILSRLLFFALLLTLPFADATAAKTFECETLFDETRFTTITSKSTISTLAASKFKSGAALIDGRWAYFEHLPAKKGQKTILVFPGLHTAIIEHAAFGSHFVDFKNEFAKQSKGEGLIIFAYSTSVESVMLNAEKSAVSPRKFTEVKTKDYLMQAIAVLHAAGITGQVVPLGYSYGASPAALFAQAFKGKVSDLIFAVPLVHPGDYSAVGQSALLAYDAIPFYGASLKFDLYRKFATSVVDQYTRASAFQPPMTGALLAEMMASQIRAADTFDLRKEQLANWPNTHFILAEADGATRLSAQNETASLASKAGVTVETTVIPKATHFLFTTAPAESVAQVFRILRR